MKEQLFSFQSELTPVSLDDVKLTLRPGSKLFKFLVSKKSYHGSEVDPLFKQHLDSWVNKEVRWRHKDDPELFVGEVRKVWNENGNYLAAMEIFGDHTTQLNVQEAIERSISAGSPIGASTNYLVLSKDGKPVSVYNREISVTDSPKCTDCRVIEEINEDKKNEEKPMADNESNDKNNDNPWIQTMGTLGEKTLTLLQNENAELKKKHTETNVLVEELNEKVTSLAGSKTELEEKVSELEEQLSTKDEKITELENELEMQTEKMPLITELLDFEKPEDDEAKNKLIEDYQGFSTEQLTLMRDKFKALSDAKQETEDKDKKIQDIPTKSDVTGELNEDLKQKISEMSPEDFTRSVYPGQYPDAKPKN